MKFIMDIEREEAINVASVKRLYADQVNSDDSHVAYVMAQLFDEKDDIYLKEFYSGDKDENFAAAKKYLAELVASLNGGQS